MSKKHKQPAAVTAVHSSGSMAEEYTVIRTDLIRVLLLNILYLAGILALYFTNAQSHYLERWFSTVFHM